MTDLRGLYAILPRVPCKGLCGMSCGPIELGDLEKEWWVPDEAAHQAMDAVGLRR